MKRLSALILAALMLTGCGSKTAVEVTVPETTAGVQETISAPTVALEPPSEVSYVSRFDTVTEIILSDEGILVNGGDETETVFTSHDIVYYEDRDTYPSGKPYGEGKAADKHTAEEAAAHTVVNITAPGTYCLSGKLSAGQIRIDLGSTAYFDPEAVVELILENADITCTVAPAILFLNTYECDGEWSADNAQAQVDTAAAGANLILQGTNKVSGSYVAKIYKDKDGGKKLWKQDGAIYSYMSLNVFGPGSLELDAENEGLDTELHLTINGGTILIRSGNDGINTNEDGVSVTTINGGDVTIFAGLDKEGDGIDSNGYLVINGGSVVSSAHPAADAGLDSDLGSYINGGTVIALGSTMDWAESDSDQVTMNLQFAQQQKAGSKITITKEDGTEIFSFEDDGPQSRNFSGLILSHPSFTQGETYHVYVDGVQMAYTGSDVGFGPGGMGFPGGGKRPEGMEMPEGFDPSQMDGNMPEGFDPSQMGGNMPEGFDPSQMGGNMPENFDPSQMEGSFPGNSGQMPEGMTPPEGFEGFQGFDAETPAFPEGETMPEGFDPSQMDAFGGRQPSGETGEASIAFTMTDKVNAFSGVMPAADATA